MTKRLNPGTPGAAFKRCVTAVEAGGSAYSPRGVCATAGRKKYGKKRFAEMAAAGKRRAKRRNPEFHLQYLGVHGDWLHARNVFTASLAEARRAFKEDIAFYEGGGSKTRVVPANRANISDRALRYRANVEPPSGPKQCAFCGSKKQVQVGHVNGREEDSSPENLIWTCRSCNVLAGNRLRKAGVGRLTVQYNPADGAKSLGQWLTAVLSMKGESDAMTVPAAVAMIRATSAAQRSRFASEIWDRRRSHGNPRNIEQGFQDSTGFHPIRKSRDYDPARGRDSSASFASVGRQLQRRSRGNPAPSSDASKSDLGQMAFDAGKDFRLSGDYYTSGVADARVVSYGFNKWLPWDKLPRGVTKAYLLQSFRQGYAAGKRIEGKRNPAEAATEAFTEFHGHQPDETVEVTKQVHFHKHLAGAGQLRRLVVKGIDHQIHSIQGFKGALLAFNEEKNQLFIEGGDQSINLQDFGITKPHELETLGKVLDLDYFTDKHHLGNEGGKAVYAHRFRTTNQDGQHVTVTIARYPDLIYRVRDEQLEFSGGSYQIKAEGIDK